MKRITAFGIGILFVVSFLFMSSGATEGATGVSYVLDAKKLYEKGQYDEAIKKAKKSTEIEPSYAPGWYWMGLSYYDQGNLDEAINNLKKVIELKPEGPQLQSSYEYLGVAYHRKGQYQEAVSSLKRAINLKPDHSGLFNWLSAAYIRLKQYDEAITAAKRAIELTPDNFNALNYLGQAYYYKKKFDEALNAFQKGIEINPQDADLYTNIAHIFFNTEDFNRAEENYKKAMELNPSIKNLCELADIYRRMGKFDDAITYVNKAIELGTFTGTGITFAIESGYPVVKSIIETGPAQKAGIEAGDKIIKVEGKSTKGWKDEQVAQKFKGVSDTQVVLTLERKGVDKPFEKQITRETILDKSIAGGLALRSSIYRYNGNPTAAFNDAEKAYALDSSYDWTKFALGSAYLDKGNYQEAIKLLAPVKEQLSARILEATAYAKLGNMNEAVNIYGSITKADLSTKDVTFISDRTALMQILKTVTKESRDKAKSFESAGQYKEALSELSKILKIADDTEANEILASIFNLVKKHPALSEMTEEARKYSLRGEILIKDGNFEEAAAEFNKAIEIAPYSARLYYNSALINAELKKYSEAIRNMKLYLQAVPDATDARAAKDEIIKWEFIIERSNKG